MKIKKDKNKLYIGNLQCEFKNDIDTILQFPNCCIVLLMNDDIPDNNVIAIGYDGNVLWNISEIIKFNYPEAYIAINKDGENVFSATTYHGIRFVVDVIHKEVTKKEITK